MCITIIIDRLCVCCRTVDTASLEFEAAPEAVNSVPLKLRLVDEPKQRSKGQGSAKVCLSLCVHACVCGGVIHVHGKCRKIKLVCR